MGPAVTTEQSPLGPRLNRSFFSQRADALAPALIGKLLVHHSEGHVLVGRILETEAYLAPEDRASHAFDNRRTARTEPMFAAPGTSYVYFSYGLHHLFNVSCDREGSPHAVLIRAVEPLTCLDLLRHRRQHGSKGSLTDHQLCSGPARLTQAFGINLTHNALDLTSHQALYLAAPTGPSALCPQAPILRSARVGVAYAQDWADRPLRWFVQGHPGVSRTKLSLHSRVSPSTESTPTNAAKVRQCQDLGKSTKPSPLSNLDLSFLD